MTPAIVSGLDLGKEFAVGSLCQCGCGSPVRGVGSAFRRGHNLNASRPAEQRLWEQVRKSDGCWEWTSPTLVDGYGLIRTGPGKKKLTHRFSYEIHHGPIPDGLQVLHRCDNRLCVRPDHLFLGTQTDNMRDMVQKGRAADVNGEKNPNARLTPEQVAEIRRLRSEGKKRREVAERFGVSTTMVSLITRGKAWSVLSAV